MLAELWNACLAGPRTLTIPPRANVLLEHFLLSKPYFDPAGLTFALDDDRPVGLALAGFAPNADGSDLDRSRGVLCLLGVVPDSRGKGIGSELLRRSEDYLRQHGARELLAGPVPPNNPFLFGLYGGANTPGFLDSSPLRAFLEKRGYQANCEIGIFQRNLDRVSNPPDPRFNDLRQNYDIVYSPCTPVSWYSEAVLGPFESIEFRLQHKQTRKCPARCVLWEMDLFRFSWQRACVGMLHLEVDPDSRRQGMSRFLLSQLLLYLQRQSLNVLEAQLPLDNTAGLNLLRGLGFEQVDLGRGFRRFV